MCFCLIYFNLGNVSSCIDMYLGIFVNRIKLKLNSLGRRKGTLVCYAITQFIWKAIVRSVTTGGGGSQKRSI